MKKTFLLLAFILFCGLIRTTAQMVIVPGGTNTDSTVATGSTTPAASTPATAGGGMTASDSLKMAFSNLKDAWGGMKQFFARKSDTVLITIAEVEYDDNNLSLLKENLKKLKPVRSVTMHYSANTATLEIACKGNGASLWEAVPAEARAGFKVTDLGNTNISLRCKVKTP